LEAGIDSSALAREFFARLAQRTLDYYLVANSPRTSVRTSGSPTTANVRSSTPRSINIVAKRPGSSAFAGGWYGKNVYHGDGLTPEAVKRFAPVAFKKIRAELRKRRDAHA
jgi:hypothetical protein